MTEFVTYAVLKLGFSLEIMEVLLWVANNPAPRICYIEKRDPNELLDFLLENEGRVCLIEESRVFPSYYKSEDYDKPILVILAEIDRKVGENRLNWFTVAKWVAFPNFISQTEIKLIYQYEKVVVFSNKFFVAPSPLQGDDIPFEFGVKPTTRNYPMFLKNLEIRVKEDSSVEKISPSGPSDPRSPLRGSLSREEKSGLEDGFKMLETLQEKLSQTIKSIK